MRWLERLTTEYVDSEDRLRLNGNVAGDGKGVSLWLTRRLLERLIPRMARWLETSEDDSPRLAPVRPTVQRFAFEAAQAGLAPLPRVAIAACDPPWVVHSVDFVFGPAGLRLVFRNADAAAGIVFTATALRQWLGILQRLSDEAGWSIGAWPGWMREDAACAAAAAPPLRH